MNMRRISRVLGIFALSALLALPLGFIATILLRPLWSWVETRLGIESIGHSGPATWCYAVTTGVLFLGLVISLALSRHTRRPPR